MPCEFTLTVGDVPVLAQRVTFVGELGWELYAPTEYMLTLWDLLLDAGSVGLRRPATGPSTCCAGEGYRVWGRTSRRRRRRTRPVCRSRCRSGKEFPGAGGVVAARKRRRFLFRLPTLVLDSPATVCATRSPYGWTRPSADRRAASGTGWSASIRVRLHHRRPDGRHRRRGGRLRRVGAGRGDARAAPTRRTLASGLDCQRSWKSRRFRALVSRSRSKRSVVLGRPWTVLELLGGRAGRGAEACPRRPGGIALQRRFAQPPVGTRAGPG